jgi:hypothetical protein
VTTTVATFIYNNFQYSRETMSNSKKTNLKRKIKIEMTEEEEEDEKEGVSKKQKNYKKK